LQVFNCQVGRPKVTSYSTRFWTTSYIWINSLGDKFCCWMTSREVVYILWLLTTSQHWWCLVQACHQCGYWARSVKLMWGLKWIPRCPHWARMMYVTVGIEIRTHLNLVSIILGSYLLKQHYGTREFGFGPI
jgi:hypothetical protein